MDREPEDLQFLGIVGIGREAFKILRSCAKLLGALTLTLLLPLSLAIMFYEMHRNVVYYLWEAGSPAGDQRSMRELTKLFLFLAAYTVFILAFSLLSTAAAVYTVASVYSGKEISYARVMSIVPTVWKRLMVTFLWFFVIFFAYYTAYISPFFLLVRALRKNYLNWRVFNVGMIFISAVFFCVHVYISMVWHLACVISVLEDKYGLGALRKSKYLIKGKRITALTLDMLYLIIGGIIALFFTHLVVYGESNGVGRCAYGILLVGLLCFLNLMGLLIQSVFYFVCKSYHHESIDKPLLSDHLEAYLGDYEPLKSSSIQLEDLHGSV